MRAERGYFDPSPKPTSPQASKPSQPPAGCITGTNLRARIEPPASTIDPVYRGVQPASQPACPPAWIPIQQRVVSKAVKHQSALPSPALSTEQKRQTHLDQFQASFPSPHLHLPSNQARPDSSRHTNVERSSSDANSGQRSANSNNRRTRDETNGRRFPRLDSTRVIPRSSPQGRTWCACEVVK